MRLALLCTVFAVSCAAQVAPGVKAAVIQAQNGILATREGNRAFGDLEARFAARKSQLDKRQSDLDALQEQLQKGTAAMSEDAQRKLARDIDRKSKALNYDLEAARTEYQEAQSDLMRELGRKFHDVAGKYAREKEIGIVVDVGNPQTPAFWWADAADITGDVVKAYDAAYPAPAKPDK